MNRTEEISPTEDRLRSTLDHVAARTEVSERALEGLASRAGHRSQLARAVPMIAAAAAIALAFVAMAELQPAPSVDVTGAGGTTLGGSADLGHWDSASLDEVVDGLIMANRSADPRPVAVEGETVVDRTYAVWSSTSVTDGSATHSLELVLHEVRRRSDGSSSIVREPIVEIEPSDDPDALRAAAQEHLESFDLASLDAGVEPIDVESENAPGEVRVRSITRDSRGSAEPQPGSTERPDQVRAFNDAAEALQSGLDPEWRIDVLEAIARIDDGLVEYRGVMPDLLGREGVAIAGYDRGIWTVLIFDVGSGDLLGALTEVTPESGFDSLPITGYTAREVVVEESRN